MDNCQYFRISLWLCNQYKSFNNDYADTIFILMTEEVGEIQNQTFSGILFRLYGDFLFTDLLLVKTYR